MADRPVRVQLSRAKGWRMPPNTVRVDRATRWGNPNVVWRDDDRQWLVSRGGSHYDVEANNREAAQQLAVDLFRKQVNDTEAASRWGAYPHPTDIIKTLRGKNLACWCTPSQPCHADVLLDIANRPLCEEVSHG